MFDKCLTPTRKIVHFRPLVFVAAGVTGGALTALAAQATTGAAGYIAAGLIVLAAGLAALAPMPWTWRRRAAAAAVVAGFFGLSLLISWLVWTRTDMTAEISIPVFERLRAAIRAALLAALPPDIADTAFALVAGMKDTLSDGVRNSFMFAGLSHVLSVSGLHISMFLLAVNWLLAKVRAPRVVTTAVVAVAAGFYVCLAGFAPSAIRAAIMGTASAALTAARLARDRLSILSLALILLLLIRPPFILDVGFQLSFAATYALYGLAPRLEKAMARLRLPRRVKSAAAAALAASVATIPFVAAHFGTVGTYTVVFNIVLVPLYMLGFVMLLVLTPFALLWAPFYRAAFPVLWSAMSLTSLVSRLPAAVLVLFDMGVWGWLFFALAVAVGRFVLKRRRVTTAILAAAMAVCLVLGNLSPRQTGYTAVSMPFGTALVQAGGVTALVGTAAPSYRLHNALRRQRVRRLDMLVLTRFSEDDLPGVVYLCTVYRPQTLVLLAHTYTYGGAALLRGEVRAAVTSALPQDARFALEVVKHDGAPDQIVIHVATAVFLLTADGSAPLINVTEENA
ncbi:MAG: ComEC/Rec2 family competence protein [Clostridiales bacterium]|jgi:ComEC/Rec2-related protein|nr:ComEC/Rec2 family competence protein [Clostridiales bacterium]